MVESIKPVCVGTYSEAHVSEGHCDELIRQGVAIILYQALHDAALGQDDLDAGHVFDARGDSRPAGGIVRMIGKDVSQVKPNAANVKAAFRSGPSRWGILKDAFKVGFLAKTDVGVCYRESALGYDDSFDLS